MPIIETTGEFSHRFAKWNENEELRGYPFIKNVHSPFTPVRRALPMLNLALITSAGAYINGTDPFDLSSKDGDINFREMPVEVGAEDLRYSAKGYDPKAVERAFHAKFWAAGPEPRGREPALQPTRELDHSIDL